MKKTIYIVLWYKKRSLSHCS